MTLIIMVYLKVVNEINSSPFRNHQFYPVESILDQMGMAIGRWAEANCSQFFRLRFGFNYFTKIVSIFRYFQEELMNAVRSGETIWKTRTTCQTIMVRCLAHLIANFLIPCPPPPSTFRAVVVWAKKYRRTSCYLFHFVLFLSGQENAWDLSQDCLQYRAQKGQRWHNFSPWNHPWLIMFHVRYVFLCSDLYCYRTSTIINNVIILNWGCFDYFWLSTFEFLIVYFKIQLSKKRPKSIQWKWQLYKHSVQDAKAN